MCRILAGACVVLPLLVWLVWPRQALLLEQFSELKEVSLPIVAAGLLGTLPAGLGFAVGLESLARFLLARGPLRAEVIQRLNRAAGWLLFGALWLALGKWAVSAGVFHFLPGELPRPPYLMLMGAGVVMAFAGVLRRTSLLLEENITMRAELEQIV